MFIDGFLLRLSHRGSNSKNILNLKKKDFIPRQRITVIDRLDWQDNNKVSGVGTFQNKAVQHENHEKVRAYRVSAPFLEEEKYSRHCIQ